MKISRRHLNLVGALLFGAVFLGAMHTRGPIIRADLLAPLILLVPFFVLTWRLSGRSPNLRYFVRPGASRAGLLLLGFAVLAVVSSITREKWFYFVAWDEPLKESAGPLSAGVLQFAILAGVFMALPLDRWRRRHRWLGAALILTQLTLIGLLLDETGGRLLYSDDHPSFIFRLWSFGENYPQLVNYNPYWNGGVPAHHGVSSGIASIALPVWPLLKFVEPQHVYTGIFIFIFLVVAPWISVGSFRLMRLNRAASYIAGLFTLGVSQHYLLWLLPRGTIGASFSMIFVLPVLASLYRILILDRTEWWNGLVLVLSVYVLVVWPLGACILVAILLTVLFHARRFTFKKLLMLTICGVAFVLIYAPNLYVIMTSSRTFEKHVIGALQSSEASSHFELSWAIVKKGWAFAFVILRSSHPLLLFLGLAGLFVYPDRRVKRWLMPVAIGLWLITAYGKIYFPGLQLHRMSMPLLLAMTIPASLWCARILCLKGPILRFAPACVLAFLVSGVLTIGRVYRNHGPQPYYAFSAEMEQLVDWIRINVPEDARMLIAGKAEHGFGQGHVASLPLLTKRQMMAGDYYHFSSKEVGLDYPPERFRKTEDGTAFFLELYNVSHVMTWHRRKVPYFDGRAELYEPVYRSAGGSIHVYRVKQALTPFWKGTGRIQAHFNRIRVELDRPQEEVVIKYNWDKQLAIDAPAELFLYSAHRDAVLIGVRPHGETNLTIRFDRWP